MRTRYWTRENLGWVSGLLEGEGCFSCGTHKYPYIRVVVAMTDRDVIEKAHHVLGVGTVHMKGPKGPNRAVWCLSVAKREDAYAIMVAIYSWMGARRKDKIRECIEFYRSLAPTKSFAEVQKLAWTTRPIGKYGLRSSLNGKPNPEYCRIRSASRRLRRSPAQKARRERERYSRGICKKT